MCFSAPASFIGSGILATIGTTLSFQVKNKRLLPLALTPLLFALQQFSEGIVWLHLDATFQDLLATGAKNVFLFFAFVIWPVWTPFALWMAEPSAWRKQVMSACFGIGLALVSFLMLTIPNTSAIAYHNSIQYLLEWKNVPHEMPVRAITLFFYGIATLLPFFFSSLRKIWILGLLTALAGLITFLIDRYLFTSMWCFFAAAISMSLFFTLPKRKR